MPAADCSIGIRIRQIEAQYISIMRWPVSGSLTDDSSDIIITSESQQKSCRTESTSATDEYYITLENYQGRDLSYEQKRLLPDSLS